MSGRQTLVRAALVIDAQKVRAAPGVLLLERGRILAAGRPEDVGAPADAEVVSRPGHVLLPALVNAHAHLDLSHLGCVPYGGVFTEWIDLIRTGRASSDETIASSVERGVALSHAGGTTLIGDIAGAGSLLPVETLRRSSLAGVSYLEVFGLGRRQAAAVRLLREAIDLAGGADRGVRLGVQPHAPYSCGPEVYGAAAALGCPAATHLAETPEEIRFAETGTGPLADALRRYGVWDETVTPLGAHPVDALADPLAATPFVAAHLNYVEPRHIELLAAWRTSVAYCPRASRYFGHPRGGAPPHAYLAMLDAGVNVALGTDGLPCLDTPDRISVLDEMRLLHRRDGTDPRTLLRMATTNGARALGVDPAFVTLAPGHPRGGVVAAPIDAASADEPLGQVLRRDDPPEWITPGGSARPDAGTGEQ